MKLALKLVNTRLTKNLIISQKITFHHGYYTNNTIYQQGNGHKLIIDY